MPNVIIDYKKKVVTKTGSPEVIGLEAKMTEKAYELSCISKTFRVPKVLCHDYSMGILKLELIENIRPISTLLQNRKKFKKIISITGECLAYIHDELSLQEESVFRFTKEKNIEIDEESNAFIHGDFDVYNVQYDFIDESVVILDWSLSPLMDSLANYESRYWDISWMVGTIFQCRPYNFNIFSRSNERGYFANIFLDTYFKNSRYKINPEQLSKYMYHVYMVRLELMKKKLKWYQYLFHGFNQKNYGNYARTLGSCKKFT